MTKDEFLSKLNAALKKLPTEERQDILQDYEEYFALGIQDGKSEVEIAAALGSPQKIAKELIATYKVEQVEEKKSAGNIFGAVWAVIGLGFFNLIIVLGPFIGLVALVIAGWVSGISFIASPLLVIVNVLVYPQIFQWFDLFFSIALAGIGLFILIGMYFATRGLMSGFIKYLKYNVNLVKGAGNHV